MNKTSALLLIAALITSASATDGKLTGLAYYDYTYDTNGGSNEFEIHRVYFNYEQEISTGIKYRFTTDIGRIGTEVTESGAVVGKLKKERLRIFHNWAA